MSNSGEAIPLGTHALFIEGDTVVLVQNGDYRLDDAVKTHEHIEKVLYSVGRVFVLVNQANAGSTDAEVRRFLAEWNKHHRVSAAAIFGGGAVAQKASALAVSVIRFLRRDPVPFGFFATERDARAWLAKQRALLETKKA